MDADGYYATLDFSCLGYLRDNGRQGQPGKSTKMVWRTCLKCTTRLSELCYDTHTLCEHVEIRYVILILFAKNVNLGLRNFVSCICVINVRFT